MNTAIDDYISERQGFRKFTPATAKATRYLLLSWSRHISDRWTDPGRAELIAWITQPPGGEARHRRRSALRAFYRWCVHEAELLNFDPTARIPSVERDNSLPKPIPQREFLRAIQGAGVDDYHALILGRLAGLRAAEIAEVHRDDIEGDHLRVKGKGRKTRLVPMHPEVRRIVEAANGWVFPSNRTTTGHVTPQAISDRCRRALPGRWTAHTLRHAFATQLYAETRNLKAVAEVLGHSSTQVTERYIRTHHDGTAEAICGMEFGGAAAA